MKSLPEITLSLQDTEWPFEYTDHDRQIARAMVIDDDLNFYFAGAHRDDIFGKGFFIETAGGGIEEGEDQITAVKRELKEELGVEVEVLCKLGVVDDYYNPIHRHNIIHYFLCKIVSFGERHLTDYEANDFDMTTMVKSYKEAVAEYEKLTDQKLGRLLANRELPILKQAAEVLEIE